MYAFLPLALRSANKWRATAVAAEPFGELGDFSTIGTFGPDYWLIQAWSCVDPGNDQGTFLAFPSAADLLLWLRFWVLPHMCRYDETVDLATTAMKTIDDAPDGGNAVELLNHVLMALMDSQAVFHLGLFMTAHDWLSHEGKVAEFRQRFKGREIFCVDGVWHMRQATWDAVWANCLENGRKGLVLKSAKEGKGMELMP